MVEGAENNQDSVLDEAVEQFLAARLRGEEPDLEQFVRQYPCLEERIRQKVQNCQRVSSLFDSLREVDESEFQHAEENADLIGKRIGAFEITEVIGRGGMGVVYKGHDTRLDRVVAIKAMPGHLLEDAAARTRFKREATLLASLNHANIGVIYDIIEQGEGVGYLVLEYAPGETLAERIAHGALKVREALSVALQIAEAVTAAHESGVIHRDLKPGNMKVTPEGKIKVLDFGLAKALSREPSERDTPVTHPGRIMGTPAYMSPEQARGRPVDRRADIWSFGCVLYEMLTGHLPFEGETTTDTLARIIEREPDWNRLPPTTPPNIRVLLRRCLAKEPHRRLQHMGDVVLDLDETLNVPPGKPSVGEPTVKIAHRERWWLGIACGLAGLTIGLVGAGLLWRRSTDASLSERSPVPTQRFVIELPENQTLGFYQAYSADRQPVLALSPDGSRLVYVARVGETTQLFERMIDQLEVRPIPGTDEASSPFFSPDGQSVGFFAEAELKVVSLLGGEPVTLCSNCAPRGGSWGSDGMIYFFRRREGLSRVPAAGGNAEPLGIEFGTPPAGLGYPQVLPGGKAVLISSRDGAVLVSLQAMEKKALANTGAHTRYVPTGHLVYIGAGAIEAVPFDLATLEVAGASAPVLEGVLRNGIGGPAQFAFSNNGLLVYAPGGDTSKSIPVWVDRQGHMEPTRMPVQSYGTFRLSPDGKRLAILVRELQRNVYIYDVARGTGTKLTVKGDNYYPLWTLDGKHVIFSRNEQEEGQWHILWTPADGSGEAELLCSSEFRLAPYSLSPDGKLLALYQLHPTTGWDMSVLPLEGDRELETRLETEFMETFPVFSPDGQWIAYASDRDGKLQIYVRPYPAMDRVWQISDGLAEEPMWSPKGDELFYRSGDNKWMVVSISTEPEFVAGTPQVLFEGPYSNVSGISYDVAPDGERFLVLKPQYDDSQVRELHVVTNWFEELKRLVPSSEAP